MSQIRYEAPELGTERLLHRPRVETLLKDALQKPLTVVVAGAGYGKTSAVSSALANARYPYAWLQLFQMDNTTAVLWKRLIDAVAACDHVFASKLRSLGYFDSSFFFYQLRRLAEAEFKDKARFVLVLDDFHLLKDENGLTFLQRLIACNIPEFSIVLISRENPGLPLAGMLSKGLMTRITEDDLRFTRDEMEEYFQMLGETLGAALNSSIYAYTEGWILAIKLMHLSLKRKIIHHQDLIPETKIDVFALIDDEFYRLISDSLKKFLFILALLDDPPAELVKELATDMPEVLAEMAKSKLLIRYDPNAKRFRMHRVLKDFLIERMDSLTDEEVKNTHFVSAQWYKENRYQEDAIHHYSQCGCYSEIFDIILQNRTRATKDVADLYVSLIEHAPEDILRERPIMRVVKAQHLFNNNRIDESVDALTEIQAEYEALAPTQESAAILGEVYILFALISMIRQNLDFVTLFKKADACLPSGSVLIDHHLNIAEGLNITGIGRAIPGELERYQAALFEAAPFASRVMNGCGYGAEYLNAADAALMTGNIPSAEKHAYEAIYRAQQWQQYSIEFMANFYLMRIFVYKGEYARIAQMLRHMKEQMERFQNTDCMTLYDIIEGWFFTKVGRPERIAKWILQEAETRKVFAPVILGREYLVRSDCLLVEGKYAELLGFMKQTDILYEQRHVLYAMIQNRITETIVYHCMGNHAESMRALETAYALSAPNNLVMQYIEYGSKMRAVAKAALKDEDCSISPAWLESILTKSSTYAKRLAKARKDYETENAQGRQGTVSLSKREVEILACVCQGLTQNEMADACGLSVNTIKQIQQSVCNKLGAVSTSDAVRIATRMGFLS